ncbi:MAG TPA: ribosome-associated translation inhibitor RaiA [Pyrinomonadaceae bacterium]|jgi:putative sigma-54 modulation protein|nr:ribosome-associated translation inhibitor RaiA [Pyrinomonadaceae bacterium]
MKFEFTGRHIEVTPALQSHVEEHFSKLDTLFEGKPASAHVIIEVERGIHRSEIVLTWWREVLTATSTDSDMYVSLSQTIAKIEKQARRLREKVIDKSHKATKAAVAVSEPDPRAEFVASMPRIIEMDGIDTKPMTPDEAVIELEGSSQQFFAFRNASSNNVAVIFKRGDGNYGLIQP